MSNTDDIINAPNASNKEKAMAYYNRGRNKQSFKQYNEAIEDFTQAIEHKPDYADAYHNRGLAKLYLDKHNEAIEDFTQAIEHKPDYADAYHNRGLAKLYLDKHNEAIEDFTQAIEHKLNYAGAYFFRGFAKGGLGNYEKAIEEFEKIIKLNIKTRYKKEAIAMTYLYKGIANVSLNKHEKAIQDFDETIIRNKYCADAYYNRAYAKNKLERYKEAFKDYIRAVELNPTLDFALLHLNTGIENLNEEKYPEALKNFNTSLQCGIQVFYENIKPAKNDALAESIFAVFQNTAKILNSLKVQKDLHNAKDGEDSMKYLSHTTRLSVLTRHLLPVEDTQMPKTVRKFRLHHITYANDPTEGSFLFKILGISQKETEQPNTMPYVMVASFSAGKSLKALDLLPIWRMYGDNARGISLLFKTDDIVSDDRRHAGSFSTLEEKTVQAFSDTQKENATQRATQEKEKDTNHPPQILYKVHYMSENDDEKNDINTYIKAIKEQLENIKRNDLSLYGQTLELLEAIRYLIKNKSYAYEREYRLLCLCTNKDIPNVLKCSEEDDASRVYVETNIAEKLCAVIIGPKVRNFQRLAIQYRLHAYKSELSKLEECEIHTSSIPYQ